ncbi:MAG: hypothetical protein Q8Q23_02160 [bacterium]|nr:hypothetical protein [bacterium]
MRQRNDSMLLAFNAIVIFIIIMSVRSSNRDAELMKEQFTEMKLLNTIGAILNPQNVAYQVGADSVYLRPIGKSVMIISQKNSDKNHIEPVIRAFLKTGADYSGIEVGETDGKTLVVFSRDILRAPDELLKAFRNHARVVINPVLSDNVMPLDTITFKVKTANAIAPLKEFFDQYDVSMADIEQNDDPLVMRIAFNSNTVYGSIFSLLACLNAKKEVEWCEIDLLYQLEPFSQWKAAI